MVPLYDWKWWIRSSCRVCYNLYMKSYNEKPSVKLYKHNYRIITKEAAAEVRKKRMNERYRTDPEFREKTLARNRENRKKRYWINTYRRWFDIWDDVYKDWVKYKIKSITQQWYVVQRYWFNWPPEKIPRRFLIPKDKYLWLKKGSLKLV